MLESLTIQNINKQQIVVKVIFGEKFMETTWAFSDMLRKGGKVVWFLSVQTPNIQKQQAHTTISVPVHHQMEQFHTINSDPNP